MGTLSQAKTLGGVGSLLMLLSIIPQAGLILGLVGAILVLVAVKYISDDAEDRSIFNNIFISFVLIIVGMIVGVVIVVSRLFAYLGEVLTFPLPETSTFFGESLLNFISGLFMALGFFWIFCIASVIFLRMSYKAIAAELKIDLFNTIALLYLIGAVLSIILVGFIIIYVAQIMQVVAFFSVPEESSRPVQVGQPDMEYETVTPSQNKG